MAGRFRSADTSSGGEGEGFPGAPALLYVLAGRVAQEPPISTVDAVPMGSRAVFTTAEPDLHCRNARDFPALDADDWKIYYRHAPRQLVIEGRLSCSVRSTASARNPAGHDRPFRLPRLRPNSPGSAPTLDEPLAVVPAVRSAPVALSAPWPGSR